MAEKDLGRAEEAIAANHHTELADPAYRNSIETDSTRAEGRQDRAQNHGVSVEQAEADFAELQREFTGVSRASRRKSRASNADPEKNVAAEDEAEVESLFDLEAALRGGLDREKEAGIKSKHIGVYWDDLTVKGFGGMSNFVPTFPDAFVGFFDVITPVINMLGLGPKPPQVALLDKFRGVCKPGEMILVLGKPGSGCTTFLKSIANQRYGYTAVEGEVLYGPWKNTDFDQYRGEAVYNAEDDVHHPTLTVEQTLGFAIDTKMPKKRPGNMSKAEFKESVISMLLKMFNIEHTRHTIVGDHFVRGVSGGERKRVSIAEGMITNAAVLSWDNSTRGLDASTALDFAKSLRIQTNLYKTTTFVSLYQASENIYNLFDKCWLSMAVSRFTSVLLQPPATTLRASVLLLDLVRLAPII
ncbi:hypothetical protein NXS19_004965 [Fusarium pseudograminearum]|nr:hypothetical protein NXS19_004965 [Fusarium pseudograminearum]